ncbi:MAG: hypothetical protein IT165_35975 [Bryobacterales bacterium]|nr:hypothetical protein [Bryobacterales bacterium]
MSEPVSQEQLAAAEDRIITAVARLLNDSETRLRDEIRGSETRLLTAFHKFAERHDARWTVARILATDAQTRIDELRDEVRAKLAEIERKQPPPANP